MPKYLPVILICTWFVACNSLQSARTCEEIASKDLRTLVQETRSSAEIRAEIGKIYGLQPEQIAEYPNEKQGGFSWSKDERDGYLTMRNSIPVVSGLNYRARQPTADAVLHCLGNPDMYGAWYYPYPLPEHTLLFHLYFSQQGVLAEATKYGTGKEPPYLDGSTPIVSFRFVPIGSPQETMKRLTEGLNPKFVSEIKPWPGRWEDIVIEIDPSLRE